MYEHQKLLVYAKAIDAVSELHLIARGLPPGLGDLRDQLLRAAYSIPLNIAEGAGEFSPSEKARFYRMARRSGAECDAILDVIGRVVASPPASATARLLLAQLGAMLTNLIKSRSPTPPPSP